MLDDQPCLSCASGDQNGHSHSRRFKLVAFDLEGTLVTKPATFWRVLHERYGTEDEDAACYRLWKGGEITIREWVKMTETMWKGRGRPSRKRIEDALRAHSCARGAAHTIKALKAAGYKVAIITAALDVLADAIGRELGVDYVYSTNRAVFDSHDRLERIECYGAGDGEAKAMLLRGLAEREGISLDECVVVGDERNDVPMFRDAGLAVAFRPKDDALIAEADHVIEYMPQLIGLITQNGQK